MIRQNEKNLKAYIAPLNMNGLQGRMLRLLPPAQKKREILFIYDRRSNLERWGELARELNRYGGVTVPDLPGFGGMQSLYKIGEKPTLDGLADYLAAFVKLRYKRRRVVIIGWGYGFLVVTRMLQRYPDLAKRVDALVSMAGFAHHDDFRISQTRRAFYRVGATVLSRQLPAWTLRRLCLQPMLLRQMYTRLLAPQAMGKLTPQQRTIIDAEIQLWRQNDVRTFMMTARSMLSADNCQVRVDLPVWQVQAPADRTLNSYVVEQHLNVIFSSVHAISARANWYDPLLTRQDSSNPHMPGKLRRLLARAG